MVEQSSSLQMLRGGGGNASEFEEEKKKVDVMFNFLILQMETYKAHIAGQD